MSNETPQYPLNPPVVWPQSDLSWEQADKTRALVETFENPRSIFGIVFAPGPLNVDALQSLISRKSQLSCRLIISVSPACATRQTELERLHETMTEFDGRVGFRLLLLEPAYRSPANCICVTTNDSDEHLLSIGSQNPFGTIDREDKAANFLWKPDPLLFESFRRWFDSRWQEAGLLNELTVRIPALVPAKGSAEAGEMWDRYASSFAQKIDPSVNGHATTEKKQDTTSVTQELGIVKLDETVERVARVFELGDQVTIDSKTRVGPLDAPIKPEWFGVESLRQFGALQRKVEYRVSIIDQKTLKDLNNKKQATQNLLKRLSFPLAHGVRWMPKKVFPLFEAEMQRVNADAQKAFKDAVGDKADLLVETQKKRLRADANQMYRDFHPDEDLSDEVFDKIVADLKVRLGKASREILIPQISRVQVSFKPAQGSQWESNWGMALTLLIAVAEFPRKALTDLFFLRGLRIKTEHLLDAMNVYSDYIVEKNKSSRVDQLARDELDLLKDIQHLEIDAKTKCKAVLCILAGEGTEGVAKALTQQEVTPAPSSRSI